jgi:sulfhydrogenase subunit beta (sulfur reductase)
MISKDKLLDVLRGAVSQDYAVFAPVKKDEGVLLERIEDARAVCLNHVLTVNTLKDVVLPRVEPLAGFNRDDHSVKAIHDATAKILVFGSRPCDAAALEILDAVLMGSVRDTRYAERRDRMLLVTVACSVCDEACFCTSMGYGPHDATGSDILLLPRGAGFLVKSITPKGKQFLEDMGIDEDLDGEPDEPPELTRHLETGKLKGWLDENFESPKWRTVSENCVSCGTCLYLCPTCHCYDIADEAGLSRGQRVRIWDCCSFSCFTRMASHQPRLGRPARYRQRTMHKFKYCVDNVNKVACVGDGRCIRFCAYGVDLCEVLESLLSEE